MSDRNRIHVPGSEQPVNISLGHGNGVVEMRFDPPITRMRLKPRETRALAISMLLHADQAEYPEPPTQPPLETSAG